jgi:thiamine biosynthesis protein ThiI
MEQVFLIRFNEIFLKSSGVAKSFLKILKQNLSNQLKQNSINGLINITNSRIFLSNFSNNDISKIKNILSSTFGIDSFSLVYKINTINQKEIVEFIKQYYKEYILSADTFKIKAKCVNVNYHTKDIEIKVADIFNAKVDLSNPQKTIYIEAREKTTFIFTENIFGLSGLPVGSAGRNLVLISGGIDSPVASFLTLKRGCHNTYLHFHSFPYVSKTSIEKVKEILLKLKKYQNDIKLILFPFSDIQNYIKVNSDPSLRIILYRRSMMRISSKIARHLKCKAITTGESLSQVSSQTLENLAVINNALNILILRPLITYNKNEIINLAKEIKTLDISNERQEDTCTLFTPKHPNANVSLSCIKAIEKGIDIENFESKFIDKIETILL